ncbi:MAG: PstS family phosphate ABC transporter substrate-binding protein [Candidatus Omnitrophica bacterium]|nr:PstS family phosphate ABC transporter substrate-binding protein [Candidatus Omnitrophota bacterium]
MKMMQLFLASICVVGVTASTVYADPKLIKVDGSSTVFPITEAVAEEAKGEIGSKVMVGISGTGGGFKRFCRGETDISDASRPIKAKEIQSCKDANIEYIEIPVAYDGLAVVVSKDNDFIDHLTVAELKKIWEPSAQGTVITWNQVRASFPNEPIVLFGPGTDSGTFDYFTEVIVGKAGSSRGDFTASEDDNVLVEGVSSESNALGYFGLAYYENNKDRLKLVPIDDENDNNGRGPIAPSSETVIDGTYQPLARPIFIYPSTKAVERPEVAKFVEYYLENAGSLVEEVGYIPLQAAAYEAALDRFRLRKTGSVFGSKAIVGLSVIDVLSR